MNHHCFPTSTLLEQVGAQDELLCKLDDLGEALRLLEDDLKHLDYSSKFYKVQKINEVKYAPIWLILERMARDGFKRVLSQFLGPAALKVDPLLACGYCWIDNVIFHCRGRFILGVRHELIEAYVKLQSELVAVQLSLAHGRPIDGVPFAPDLCRMAEEVVSINWRARISQVKKYAFEATRSHYNSSHSSEERQKLSSEGTGAFYSSIFDGDSAEHQVASAHSQSHVQVDNGRALPDQGRRVHHGSSEGNNAPHIDVERQDQQPSRSSEQVKREAVVQRLTPRKGFREHLLDQNGVDDSSSQQENQEASSYTLGNRFGIQRSPQSQLLNEHLTPTSGHRSGNFLDLTRAVAQAMALSQATHTCFDAQSLKESPQPGSLSTHDPPGIQEARGTVTPIVQANSVSHQQSDEYYDPEDDEDFEFFTGDISHP